MGSPSLFVALFFRTCASLSLAGSTAVVLTGLVFPRMLSRRFMQLIVTISVCDAIGSAVSTMGVVSAHSRLCVPQAVLRIFFFRSSWMWTALLASQLYSTVILGGFWISNISSHVLIWSLSLPLVFLPLINTTYGQDDGVSGEVWCSFTGTDNPDQQVNTALWLLAVSTIPLVICLIICIWLTMAMYIRFHGKDLSGYPQIQRALYSIRLYPIALIVCWIQSSSYGIAVNFGLVPINNTIVDLLAVSEGFASLYGLAVSAIFFVKSTEARARWCQMFQCATSSQHADEIPCDFDADCHARINLSPRLLFGTSFMSDTVGNMSLTHSETSSSVSSMMHQGYNQYNNSMFSNQATVTPSIKSDVDLV